MAEGVRAAGEADAGVRAAGCRLLGLLVKGPDFVAVSLLWSFAFKRVE